MAVHPHACGENRPGALRRRRVYGPPPRVWGKREFEAALIAKHRSTPTRVGKTASGHQGSCFWEVHPHACGENIQAVELTAHVNRSTPTRVGKTGADLRRANLSGVHPHACGEN